MVTAAARHKVNLDPIRDAHIILLEVQEDGNATVHRAAVNVDDIVSNGETYTATDINVTVPNSGDDEVSVSISMTNVDRLIGKAIGRARNRIGVRIMLIDSSAPDTLLRDSANLLVLTNMS